MYILLAAQHRHAPARRSTPPFASTAAPAPAPAPARRRCAASLLAAVTAGTLALAAPGDAAAHPQSSPDRNNRYLKLTPMADRLRLAYTIYLGDQPGAQVRRRLDRDRDGQLTDAEAAVIGRELATMVAPAVELRVDGVVTAIDWAAPYVGLGTPATAGGALSVDLIGWACTGDGARHQVALYDRVKLELPGELEVRLEDAPGVGFVERRLGGEPMRELIETWRSDEERLARGLEVVYEVDGQRAMRPQDRRCTGRGAAGTGSRTALPYVVAALVAAALAALAALTLARRPRARSGPEA